MESRVQVLQEQICSLDRKQVRDEGFTIAEFIAADLQCYLKAAGFTLGEVKAHGCKEWKYAATGQDIRDVYTVEEVLTAGHSVLQARDFGFRATDLIAGGVRDKIREAGFTLADLKAEDVAPSVCKSLGFTVSDFITAELQSRLQDVGFALGEMKAQGVTLSQCEDWKYAVRGQDIRELYSVEEVLAAGYSPKQARDFGFGVADFISGGGRSSARCWLQTCRLTRSGCDSVALQELGLHPDGV
eukprot:TRINITY_DN77165_c0_g1_i1.p1 TRINITY_DN77165_c0_g1~~TRINITY_DN77165_c0_g1_i1.p1  ORF type:complete len:243 (-),score=38.43 TRINITY_DN77165_c0_g1_i1:177-905(-)